MQTLAKNENRDLYLDSSGNIAISTDLQACLEACENAVSTLLGEQIYQIDEGMPNFELIWNGTPNYKQFEIAIRNTLESVENVLEVTNFSFDVAESNTFRYNAEIKTIFGLGVVNGL